MPSPQLLSAGIVPEETIAQEIPAQEAHRPPDRGPEGGIARCRAQEGAGRRTPGAAGQRTLFASRESASTTRCNQSHHDKDDDRLLREPYAPLSVS